MTTLIPGTVVHAQPYARFAVDDSAMVGAVRASGAAGFETAWNALLVAELRASLARADSAARLAALARRVSIAEPAALGSRIAGDALAMRARWTPAQQRLRVSAAVDESLGAVARRIPDYPRADSLYRAALVGYRRLGEPRRTTWALAIRANMAIERKDWHAADSLGQPALDAARALGDPRLNGIALNTLGSAAYSERRLDDAWRYYQGARAAREQSGERGALGATLSYLGNVAAAQGRADSAEVCYRAALALVTAVRDTARMQDILNNYGALLAHGPDPAAAFPVYEQALAIRRQTRSLIGQAETLLNIGDLLRQQGHYAEATERLEQARAIAVAAGDLHTLRMSLVNLGRTALGVGDADGARAPLERALGIADSLGDAVARAEALSDLSLAARLSGDGPGASRMAAQVLAVATAAGDSALVHDAAVTLGELAFDTSDFTGAQRWFERAAAVGAIGSEQRSGDQQNLAAVAARTGRLDRAEQIYRQALALADSSGVRDAAWPALLGLGDVAERRGDPVQALAYDRQAAATIEVLRARQGSERPSVHLLARRLFAFEALIHLLVKLGPTFPDSAFAAEAFHWSERARARAFLDLVAASGSEPLKDPVRPLTMAEAQARIDSDAEALLVYSVGDSSTSLWVVRRNTWRQFRLPPRSSLRPSIQILRSGLASLAQAEAPATQRASATLYRTLIEPARDMLRGVDHLIIAPDDCLRLLPFEVLGPDGGAGRTPGARFLVERYAVSYVPSASAMGLRSRDRGDGGIVAAGNAVFAPGTLPPLPATAQEVEALVALAGTRPTCTLTGLDATRERLLAMPELPRAALIHIATHGSVDEVEPERSGLWMAARDSAGPGFISVADVLGLRLNARLVTLSACETGLGRLERGEGVMGLSRSFLAAGAGSVLVSLWKVNDRSTARLMEGFYRPLLETRATEAAALARAKRGFLRSPLTRSPFYWAPFVLIGDAGRL